MKCSKRKCYSVYSIGRTGKKIQLGGAVAINKKNALKQVQKIWESDKVKIGKVVR